MTRTLPGVKGAHMKYTRMVDTAVPASSAADSTSARFYDVRGFVVYRASYIDGVNEVTYNCTWPRRENIVCE